VQVAQGQISKDEVSALIYENMQPLESLWTQMNVND
jgi:hypothetical protein